MNRRKDVNLDYNTYHTFEVEGTYYLFDNERLISCIIEKHVYDALKTNDETLLTEEERQMFDIFRKQNIFFVDKPRDRYSYPTYNMVVISMALVHGCNLKCKYCFADAGENFVGEQRGFTEESINASIDFLLNDPYFSKMDYYRINLVSGGEPLLNKPLFKLFIETAFARFEQAGKHLYVWFSTNGTLLTEEDLIFISKYNVGYGISIDGNKLANDKLRVYGNGTGTYNDIVENIKTIQNSSAVPKRLKELWGLMVYTRDNIELLDNITHLYNLGFSTVQMRFVRSNDENLVLDNKEATERLLDFIKKVFEKAIAGDDSLLRLITNDNDYIGKIIKRIITNMPSEVRCSAGSYMFSFAADGNIYPCDCFVGNPNFVMGSFYDTITAKQFKKYRDMSVHVREKCQKCWAKYACGGDCYHNSYIKHSNLLIPDDSYCKLILQVIECIIALLNQYEMKNRDQYSAFCNFLQIRERMSRK